MVGNQKITNDGIVIYKSRDGKIELNLKIEKETIWLTQNQIADLFGTKRPAITKHLGNIFKSKELDKATVSSILELSAADGKIYKTQFYNLDAIISVGYRVNSLKATQFRIWATSVLKDHLVKGFTINEKRIIETDFTELQRTFDFIKNTFTSKEINNDEIKGILNIITKYANSWFLLQKYDEGDLPKPKSAKANYKINYQDCCKAIEILKKDLLQKNQASNLFGNQIDKGTVENLTFCYKFWRYLIF